MRIRRPFAGLAFLLLCLATTAAWADSKPILDTSGVNLQPAYPASAMPMRETGAVVVSPEVDETGKVLRIRLLQTSGYNDLDSAAIAAVFGWHFLPAMQNGKATTDWAILKLAFQPMDATPGEAARALDQSSLLFAPTIETSQMRANGEIARSVPCSNGTFEAIVHLQVSAQAGLVVSSGSQAVMLQAVSWPMPAQTVFSVTKSGGGGGSFALNFDRPFVGTQPASVSLSWDSTGLITAVVGNMQRRQIQLTAIPKSVAVAIWNGNAKFEGARLICMPDNPPATVR